MSRTRKPCSAPVIALLRRLQSGAALDRQGRALLGVRLVADLVAIAPEGEQQGLARIEHAAKARGQRGDAIGVIRRQLARDGVLHQAHQAYAVQEKDAGSRPGARRRARSAQG